MSSIHQYTASDFSPHLFWDVDKNKLDLEINRAQIIQQVLEYGLLQDWLLIKKIYGIQQIAETARKFRNLDPMALSFIVTLSGLPIESFTCYTTRQLMPPHWNF
jgi:hypothetical protein